MKFPPRLRKILGGWKCKLIDEWPYAINVRRMPELRRRLSSQISSLPKISGPGGGEYEIHMLCGHRDHDMGIWASWSVMRFLEGKGKLYVHDDGTLTDTDAAAWRNVIEKMTVIPRADADAAVAIAFQDKTQHLYNWRCNYRTSPQLVDAHLFGEAPVLLVMDSDVLVFEHPGELVQAMSSPRRAFAWCLDLRNSYSTSPELMREVTGVQLPGRFNCGMMVTPRLSHEDFLRLDQLMERMHTDGRIDLRRYWACQTYYALLAAQTPGSRALPESYSTTDGPTPASAVLRHYVGIPKVRFRYFSEGVPRILKQITTTTRGLDQ